MGRTTLSLMAVIAAGAGLVLNGERVRAQPGPTFIGEQMTGGEAANDAAGWLPASVPDGAPKAVIPQDAVRYMRAGDGGAQIPEGFEIVQITNDPEFDRAVSINNCGQIVFSKRMPLAQIFLYDNGILTRLSAATGVREEAPDINDEGTIVWTHDYGDYDENVIFMLADGEVSVVGFGSVPAINNLGHVA